MNGKMKATILIGMIVATTQAHSAPTQFPAKPERLNSVINRTNSSILSDNKDDGKLWVMPPQSGSA